MELLVTLSLIYAGILVLALALGLLAIHTRLRHIDRALDATRAALRRACSASRPLEEELRPVEEELAAAMEAVNHAADELSSAREALQQRVGREPAAHAGS